MTYYIPEEGLDAAFEYVSKHYSHIEEVPSYRDEPGFEKLRGIFIHVQSDTYYPSLLDKAAYLLIGINKGHFFSNGNKRLAIVVMTLFLSGNSLGLKRGSSKEWYRETLGSLFPEYAQWGDFSDFSSTDFATYNLSIMIADSGTYGIDHDELKRRVYSFLETATEPL